MKAEQGCIFSTLVRCSLHFVSLRFPSAEEMAAFNQKEYDIIPSVQQNSTCTEDVDTMAMFTLNAKEPLQAVSDRL